MKLASDGRLDDALYLWFAQKRSQGIPVSDPIIMVKALELNYWKIFPTKMLASRKEEKAPGYKVSKERVTILTCANATGDHKLCLTMIVKAKNLDPLRHCHLMLFHGNTSQKSAWMTSDIFTDCFFMSLYLQ